MNAGTIRSTLNKGILHEYSSKYRESIIGFLSQLPESYESFNVADIPVSLWPHIFILDAQTDGSLNVRLTGTAIESGLAQSCHGLIFTDVVHGPRSENVLAAFKECPENGWSGLMCQAVKISNSERILSITAGIKRLCDKNGEPTVVLGLMFLDISSCYDYNKFGFASETL